MKRPNLTTERGVTLIEILTVMIMIGIIVSMGIPRFSTALQRQDLRGAHDMFTTMHAKARASAVSRGRRTAFGIKDGSLIILSQNPVSGAVDTVGTRENIVTRYGVTWAVNPTTRDTLVFDARGLGTESATTFIYLSKSTFADTVEIGALGRVIR